jgi:hypothetical protein
MLFMSKETELLFEENQEFENELMSFILPFIDHL